MLSSGAAACLPTSLTGARSPRERLGPTEPKILVSGPSEKDPPSIAGFLKLLTAESTNEVQTQKI